MDNDIVMVPCMRIERSARGRRLGEQSPCWKHPDSVVVEARRLRATGIPAKQVAVLMNIPYPTLRDWFRPTTPAGRPTGRPSPTHVYFEPCRTH